MIRLHPNYWHDRHRQQKLAEMQLAGVDEITQTQLLQEDEMKNVNTADLKRLTMTATAFTRLGAERKALVQQVRDRIMDMGIAKTNRAYEDQERKALSALAKLERSL